MYVYPAGNASPMAAESEALSSFPHNINHINMADTDTLTQYISGLYPEFLYQIPTVPDVLYLLRCGF